MPKISLIAGVYKITNLVNNKVYVGGAYKSFIVRLRSHRYSLDRGDHFNRHLQSAWKKYGSKNFRFSIIERCLPKLVALREQFWIDKLDAAKKRWNDYRERKHAENNSAVK